MSVSQSKSLIKATMNVSAPLVTMADAVFLFWFSRSSWDKKLKVWKTFYHYETSGHDLHGFYGCYGQNWTFSIDILAGSKLEQI